uniref:Si:ch211-235m3.10 n=1 Tax=Amphiprion percula TaxID=161767 RepID=A0A3P8SWV3_AMPPE
MESTRSLAQVIMEMRDEIKKLEAENRELRGHSGQRSFGATPGEAMPVSAAAKQQAGVEENPYVNLRRNASAPALEGQYKTTVMTVRRYSTSSSLSGVTMREGRIDRSRRANSGWGRLQEQVQHGNTVFGNSGNGEVGKVTNRHSLQEYVHKNAKVKTVTFLLPVDDIYTSRPVLSKHREEPKITDLAAITETDS